MHGFSQRYKKRTYLIYSGVHKRWHSFFSKILEKPSIVQKKMLPHTKGLDFSQIWSKKKIQNGRLRKFKMAASKKTHFPAPPILNICSWKFHGLVLGLVELIDAKGLGLAQLIWSWGCPTQPQKQPKNTKNAFFACFWAYVGQPHGHVGWAISIPFESINSTT